MLVQETELLAKSLKLEGLVDQRLHLGWHLNDGLCLHLNVDVNVDGAEERLNVLNSLAQLRESDATERVDGEDASEDGVCFLRDRQQLEEGSMVVDIAAETLVLADGLLPRVARANHVGEDNTESPDVGSTGAVRARSGVEALCDDDDDDDEVQPMEVE